MKKAIAVKGYAVPTDKMNLAFARTRNKKKLIVGYIKGQIYSRSGLMIGIVGTWKRVAWFDSGWFKEVNLLNSRRKQ